MSPARLCYLALLLLLCTAASVAAEGADSWHIRLDASVDRVPVGGRWHFLEDPTHQLDIAAARAALASGKFQTGDGNTLNFGFSRSAYWLHLQIRNDNALGNQWLLEIQYPALDSIEVYEVRADGSISVQSGGDRHVFASRAMPYASPNFWVNVKPDEEVAVFVRIVTSGVVQTPATLWRPHTLAGRTNDETAVMGLYLGLTLALMLYNLITFAATRDRSFLLYSLFALFCALGVGIFFGYAHKYLWPQADNFNNNFQLLFMALAGVALIAFTRQFLDVPRHHPGCDRALLWLVAIFITTVPLIPFYYREVNQILNFTALATPPVLLTVGMARARRGIRAARFYLVAWFAFLVCMFIFYAKQARLLPVNAFTEYSLLIGSSIEMLLLSLALADRYRAIMDRNLRLQRDTQSSLEAKVEVRTRELNAALESLEAVNRDLRRANLLDPLTGIRNRRYFDQRLESEWQRAIRSKEWLALLLIDLDRFKPINDTFGHAIGDQCLIAAARAINEAMRRAGDRATRYGGEEFACVLPTTNPLGATNLAEVIRREIATALVTHAGGTIRLTASIGVAAIRPTVQMRPEQLITLADQALYKAKNTGRNRVCVAPGADSDAFFESLTQTGPH